MHPDSGRHFIAVLVTLAAIGSPVATSANAHELVTRVDGASVRMLIPPDARVGSSARLSIQVTPEPGAPVPHRIRTRVGMPDHGHWVSDEAVGTADENPMVHMTDLPMGGVYRLRVWLDYAYGRVVRTGADFDVDGNGTHAPRAAP